MRWAWLVRWHRIRRRHYLNSDHHCTIEKLGFSCCEALGWIPHTRIAITHINRQVGKQHSSPSIAPSSFHHYNQKTSQLIPRYSVILRSLYKEIVGNQQLTLCWYFPEWSNFVVEITHWLLRRCPFIQTGWEVEDLKWQIIGQARCHPGYAHFILNTAGFGQRYRGWPGGVFMYALYHYSDQNKFFIVTKSQFLSN